MARLRITRQADNRVDVAGSAFDEEAGVGINLDEPIPDDSADLPVAVTFSQEKLIYVYLVSVQDMTIAVNDESDGSPQEVIELKAGRPLEWSVNDGYFDCPFSGDVTGFYVTKGGGGEAFLRGRFLVDPT